VIVIRQLDDTGRWWQVGRFEVDLLAVSGTYPANVQACALAHRDAVDDEGLNVAAILATQVEAEDFQPLVVTSAWLFAQSQRILARIWERIDRVEGHYHQPIATFLGAGGPEIAPSIQHRQAGCHDLCPCLNPKALPTIQEKRSRGYERTA
jgi:hypothetical protein